MRREAAPFSPTESGLTRKGLLKRAALTGLAVSGSGLLAACGSSTSASSSVATEASTPGGKPIRGGTFTVGMLTGGPGETINPALVATYPDIARTLNLYDTLFNLSPSVSGLATPYELLATF